MSVTFNGTTIPFAQSDVGELATRDKVVDFPGADGVEVLPMGRGDRECVVEGISTAGSPSRATIEGLMDDETHTLVVENSSYANVRCVGVRWGKTIYTLPGGYKTRFALRFRQEVPD
jgi:uncharacterized Ntn-hydrolase superfamily protein